MFDCKLMMTLPVKDGVPPEEIAQTFLAALPEAIQNVMKLEPYKKPRVLITVDGGIADYVSDDGVDVFVFDRDNFESDASCAIADADGRRLKEVEDMYYAPAKFKELAEPIDVPVSTT